MSRAPHKPTEESRRQVKAMTGYGLDQDDVAAVIGISDVTLRKYYPRELKTGAPAANALVGESLHWMATKGRNPAAAIWWTKTRMGWKETVRIGGEGENGAIIFQVLTGVPRAED